jgi:hypothetical protein
VACRGAMDLQQRGLSGCMIKLVRAGKTLVEWIGKFSD